MSQSSQHETQHQSWTGSHSRSYSSSQHPPQAHTLPSSSQHGIRDQAFGGADRRQFGGFYEPTSNTQVEASVHAMSQMPARSRVDRGRSVAVDPRPTGFEALQQAMEYSPSPPPSPPPQGDSMQTSSAFSKTLSFLKGTIPLKATLVREFGLVRDSIVQRMSELGVRWNEPYGRGSMWCEYGQIGTTDYVAFDIRFTTYGGTKPVFPGAEMWKTKVHIGMDRGSGHKFRELGNEILDAAKYEVRGGARLDYSVTTWGLY